MTGQIAVAGSGSSRLFIMIGAILILIGASLVLGAHADERTG